MRKPWSGSASAGHVHFALTPSKWMPFLDAVQELQYGGVHGILGSGLGPPRPDAPTVPASVPQAGF